jgi:hypothetical protein
MVWAEPASMASFEPALSGPNLIVGGRGELGGISRCVSLAFP